MKLGFTVFPIAPKNGAAVIAHLVGSAGIVQLYVSEDPAMQGVAQAVNTLLADKKAAVQILPMIRFAELGTTTTQRCDAGGVRNMADNDVAIILHSSGEYFLPY